MNVARRSSMKTYQRWMSHAISWSSWSQRYGFAWISCGLAWNAAKRWINVSLLYSPMYKCTRTRKGEEEQWIFILMEHADRYISVETIAESSLFLDFSIETDVTCSFECRSHTCDRSYWQSGGRRVWQANRAAGGASFALCNWDSQ